MAAGCATVNPQPDYQQAATYAAHATGQARLFDPTKTADDAQYVQTLVADGITADEAAQIALLNNPQLRAALYDIGAARADLVQSGLLSNPSLGVAFRLPAAGGLANIDFDLAQNIADLWQIPVRQRAAQRSLDQTILTIARLASSTAASAKQAYYNAVGADQRLTIARDNLDVGRKVLELTEFRRQAGAGNELDVNLARGVLLEAELAVKQLRLTAASNRRALATILGLSQDADALKLADMLPEPPAHVFDDAALVAAALRERYDAQALRQSARSAEERYVLEIRSVFPNVAVGLAFEREQRPRAENPTPLADIGNASVAAGQLSPPPFEPWSDDDVDADFIIGPSLSLELPIFDQNQAQIAKAKTAYEQRLRQLEGLERTIHQEVRDAVDQARTAWEVARFYRDEVVPQASRSLALSRDSYHAGQSSILSVLDAERSYLTARDRYAAAVQQAAGAIPALEQAVGLTFVTLANAPPSSQPIVQPAAQSTSGAIKWKETP